MIAVLIGLGVLLFTLVTNQLMRRAIARPPAAPPRSVVYPSVTVIRPIRGLDVGEAANLEAMLATGYPGAVETLFVFDEASDPAYPYACRAAARHPGTRVLVAGAPPKGRTGKLNAMIKGLEQAKGELIAFSDSDTQPDKDVLRLLVEALVDDDRAGVSFAPVVVHRPARTAGDAGYALLINVWYGASVALARRDGALPFIMGQLMVWRRSALAAIGGLAVADGQLVDDMYLGAKVAEAGLRNVMIDHPLHITTGGMSFGEHALLMRRWFAFGRTGLPVRFAAFNGARAIACLLAFFALGLALVRGEWLAALVPAFALFDWLVGLMRLERRFGGARIPLRYWWMGFAVPIGGPIAVASILLHRKVAWRGRDYDLDGGTRLRESSSHG
jgi:ceramide glucosyltransferase